MHSVMGPSAKEGMKMRPEHEARRVIIREWMSLSKEKRQTKAQAEAFAKKVMERVPCSGDPYQRIMSWLLPRIAKS
jgi:hypothetical protein